MNLHESTSEVRELIDAKLVAFNKANVPFQNEPSTPNARVFASLVIVFILVAIANFLQALSLGLIFGTTSLSDTVLVIDLMSRWVLIVLAAYMGGYVARERYALIAICGAIIALLFGGFVQFSAKESITTYNFASLFVLVSAVASGAYAHRFRFTDRR